MSSTQAKKSPISKPIPSPEKKTQENTPRWTRIEPLPIVRTLFLALIKQYPGISGYSLIIKVEEFTKGEVRLRTGTVYNELRKMETKELVTSVQEPTRRKIRRYRLTPKGEEELRINKKLIEQRVESILLPLLHLIDSSLES